MAQEMDSNSSKSLSTMDIASELGKDNEEVELKDEDLERELETGDGEKEAPKKETKKESKEADEDEEVQVDEEDLEISSTVSRKQILSKYPNLFKDFPDLQRAFYREQAFTEVFPTVQDAKDAQERVAAYDAFEKSVFDGDLGSVLSSVRDADHDTFVRLSENFLPSLNKLDQPTYHGILGNIFKNAAVAMFNAGTERSNENLKVAAQILNEFIFGSGKIEAPQPLSKPKQAGEDKLAQEREKFNQERLDSARESLDTKVTNLLTSTIERYLDPNSLMTSYTKRNAIKDALSQIDDAITGDSRFRATYDKLWERAAQEGFSPSAMTRLRNAYISTAKNHLAPVIKRVRAEALKDARAERTEDEPAKQKLIPPGKPTGTTRKVTSAKEIPRNMKSIDFLNSD